MPDYTFTNLSPLDFEELCRDLLQKELEIRFESFGPGKDAGIDFRYTTDKSNGIVVQCKRYEHWKDLWPSLKKELPKVRQLQPYRYILVTSCPINDTQKSKILKLFDPYILNRSDIIGRGDLNNLLSDFRNVELNHPKLWIPSTNVLERVLHSRVVNQVIAEKKQIERTLQVYVENESYARAVKILNERRWVIISGIPGIGKTTLARMLVASFMAQGFEELVTASDSIRDAFELAKEDTSQIFFFDDFLGRVFLNKELPTNEDKRIKTFIDIAEGNKNKLFILTTREYILSQAIQRYEFRKPSIELSKCIVELEHYTRKNRARILYNHLYYSNIGVAHLNDLLRDKNYLKIIDHKNYSPRLVEEMISIEDMWRSIPHGEFTNRFLENLEDQELIWSTAFENEISRFSQYILINLITAGTPIYYEDLRTLMVAFASRFSQKYGFSYSGLDFKKAMRELEQCFISVDKAKYGDELIVTFHNPSIEDFLINYLRSDEDLIYDILDAAPLFNQFFNIFTLDGSNPVQMFKTKLRGRIVVDGTIKELIINRTMSSIAELGSSELESIDFPRKKREGPYSRLDILRGETRGINDKRIDEFLKAEFTKVSSPSLLMRPEDYREYVCLSRRLGPDYFENKPEILKRFFAKVCRISQFEEFEKLEPLFPEEYEELTQTDDFKEHLRDVIERETDDADDSETLESVLAAAEQMNHDYNVFIQDLKDTLEEKIEEAKEEEEGEDENNEQIILPENNEKDEVEENADDDEDKNIDSMFDSLRELKS